MRVLVLGVDWHGDVAGALCEGFRSQGIDAVGQLPGAIESFFRVVSRLAGALFRWLLDNDLVDQMTLFIFPVVVGQGTRLFPGSGPDAALDLVESRSTPKGVTIQVYRPAGRPRYETATPD